MERALEQWKSKEVARLLALVETERRYYQEMVANLPICVAVLNSQCSIVAVNRAFQQNYGIGGGDLRKRSIDQVFPSAELQARIQSVLESGIGSRPLVMERTSPGGGVGHLQRLRISVQAIRDWDEDSGLQALMVVEDLAESSIGVQPPPAAAAGAVIEPTLAAAPESEFERAQRTLEFSDPLPCVIWKAHAADRTFIMVSPSAKALLDFEPEEWISSSTFFADRIEEEDRTRTIAFYDQSLTIPGLHSCEFRMRRGDGWYRETILVESGSDTLTGVITNVTARRSMEEQLLQAQRVDAVTQLAGRLAHDTNNPLMIVNGYAEDLARTFPPDDPRAGDIREIQLAGKRIGELTGHLQSVTRRQTAASRPIDIGAELVRVVERMRTAAGEYLQVTYVPAKQQLTGLADAGQLEPILLELSAALVEGGGESADLRLSAKPYRVSESARGDQPLMPGAYVELSIVNQGHGAPLLPSRMFESLLPGKEPGRDSGPAMARAFKTVQEWGGTILAIPNDSQIRVYLKAVPGQPADPGKTTTKPAAGGPALPTKAMESLYKGRILIVEDEPGIRALMRKILQREGFEVFEAANGSEALDLLMRDGPVNLLITDVLMPGMTGRELATSVQALYPNCGILYMSGFTADTEVETGQFPPGSHFLQKPFTLGSLLRKANEVLASVPRSRAQSA